MPERDKTLLEILMMEKETQEQSLRACDTSLHQLAFAYIAAFALSVPAVLTGYGSLSSLLARVHFASFVVCTIIFIGAFYSLMLVKSRNVYLAHIAFLSDKINELVERSYGVRSKILFQQSTEISGFYYGKAKGWVWFLFYIAFFVCVFVWFCCSIYLSLCVNWPLAAAIVIEAIVAIAMYAVFFATGGGIRSVRRQIEIDYEKWLESCPEEGFESTGQEHVD